MQSIMITCAVGLKFASGILLLADACDHGSWDVGLGLAAVSLAPVAWIVANQIGISSDNHETGQSRCCSFKSRDDRRP